MQKVKDKIIPIILIAIMAVSGYKIVTYFLSGSWTEENFYVNWEKNRQ